MVVIGSSGIGLVLIGSTGIGFSAVLSKLFLDSSCKVVVVVVVVVSSVPLLPSGILDLQSIILATHRVD